MPWPASSTAGSYDGILHVFLVLRHNWAWSMFESIRATGYELGSRVDEMDIIDTTALKQHI